MKWPLLAIVEISLVDHLLSHEEIQKIETLLRDGGTITNLSVQSDKIHFFMWGEEKINYALLDKIKEDFTQERPLKFSILAREYAKNGIKYSFNNIENPIPKTLSTNGFHLTP